MVLYEQNVYDSCINPVLFTAVNLLPYLYQYFNKCDDNKQYMIYSIYLKRYEKRKYSRSLFILGNGASMHDLLLATQTKFKSDVYHASLNDPPKDRLHHFSTRIIADMKCCMSNKYKTKELKVQQSSKAQKEKRKSD